MVIFDTNMVLRYLLNDNEQMADRAEQYLQKGNVFVTVEVIAEVIYVLTGVYTLKHDTVAKTVRVFLALVQCKDMDVLNLALETYGERNLDFVDCVLYAYHCARGAEIATFDKKLLKLMAEC